MAFAVWSAKRRVRPDVQERRAALRAKLPDADLGESDEDWALGTELARKVVEKYGHLYDDNGDLIEQKETP